MKERPVQREEGQSLIIIATLLIVLIALVGLVVDAGNAYAQRRIVQNAVDAAALAGAQELAKQDDWQQAEGSPDFLTNGEVILAVERFAELNGVDPDTLSIWYADAEGNILANARELNWDRIIWEETWDVRAESVVVEGALPFPTYLVRILGRDEMTAAADAQARLACGACSAGDPKGGGLFPIAFHVSNFDADNGFPVYGKQYTIWDKDPHFPGTGSFGYLSWWEGPNPLGSQTANTTLADNMADTSRSGRWSVGNLIPTGPGVQNSNAVENQLSARIANMDPTRPATVTLPIFDYTTGTGANLNYHIVGFANFRIDCYHFSKNHKDGSCAFDPEDNSKWISGKFVKGLIPSSVAGCSNYGVCTAEITPPLQVKRVLKGRVSPWRVFVEKNATPGMPESVDVLHVVDISGSMCASWSGSGGSSPCTNSGRLATAKEVLTGFNRAVEDPTDEEFADLELGDWDPDDDNRVGLATYPTMQSTSNYNTDCYDALGSACRSGSYADCGQSNNLFYFASKDNDLTGDIVSVNSTIQGLTANGGTSMPRGLQYGREMLMDEARRAEKPDNLPVLILTTDGMPNIKINGEWTGYLGNYTRPPAIVESGCNDSVYQAAVQQANTAKEQGAIIFTIGIQETIDTALMQAIASADTHPDKPHFFQAHDEDDFAEIYRQILTRLPSLGSEECIADENAAIGNGATVYLYSEHGSLLASTAAGPQGDYEFDFEELNLDPGWYQLRATWEDHLPDGRIIQYDVMTWTLGGDEATEPIMVEMPLGKQEIEMNLYLRTDHEFTCD